MPSQAWAEFLRVPSGFLEQLIEYRGYAATKAAYDHHQNPQAESEMWQLVKVIEFELAAEEIATRE